MTVTHVTTCCPEASLRDLTQGGEKQVESIRAAVRLVLRLLWKRLRQLLRPWLQPVVVAHKVGADGRPFGTVKAEAIKLRLLRLLALTR